MSNRQPSDLLSDEAERLARVAEALLPHVAQLTCATARDEAAPRPFAAALDAVQEGVGYFDGDDRLVASNTRFCAALPDMMQARVPGTRLSEHLAQMGRSSHLLRDTGETAEQWCARQRAARDAAQPAHVTLLPLDGTRWLQLCLYRLPKGGTLVLHNDVSDRLSQPAPPAGTPSPPGTEMLYATLDHLNQGVGIFNDAAQLVGWNRKLASLLALPDTQLEIGRPFTALLAHLALDVRFAQGLDRIGFLRWAARTGARAPISFEIEHGEGRVLQVFGQGMPDRGFLISVTDISAEREATRKLFAMNELLEQRVYERTVDLETALNAAERANASKSRFVAAASHDLLQPLSAAKLYVSSLAERLDTAPERAVLEKAESAISSAETMIDALLDISRLDSDGIDFDIRPVALRDILRPLADEMGVLAERKGLALHMVDTALVVESDATYLRRVIQNLLANAIRYTDTGKVLLGVRRAGDRVRIEVHDTGPGIAKADQAAIFEEFRRLEGSGAPAGGLGLGLAIVERACARLDHPVRLRSELGRGSCFSVSVPLAGLSGSTRAQRRPRARAGGLSHVGLLVLVVAPDTDGRRALTSLMESWGVHVIEAPDETAALQLVDDLELSPDALLLEAATPSAASVLALSQRVMERLGPLPCALLAADRPERLRQDCKILGVELLARPPSWHQLGRFLEEVARAMG